MITISPSVLSCDFLNIENELNTLNGLNDIWLHLDIMDGHFVPNLTFGHPVVKLLSKKAKMPLDAHFMVENPEFYCDTFKDYNIHNFTFHHEATDNSLELIKRAKEYYPSVGISIKPKTDHSALSDEVLKAVDLILVMSVEPGFGGQSFIDDSLSKVESLVKRRKELNTSFSIQIDGGINFETAPLSIHSGVDNLVSGSFIFKNSQSEYSNIIESLRKK